MHSYPQLFQSSSFQFSTQATCTHTLPSVVKGGRKYLLWTVSRWFSNQLPVASSSKKKNVWVRSQRTWEVTEDIRSAGSELSWEPWLNDHWSLYGTQPCRKTFRGCLDLSFSLNLTVSFIHVYTFMTVMHVLWPGSGWTSNPLNTPIEAITEFKELCHRCRTNDIHAPNTIHSLCSCSHLISIVLGLCYGLSIASL